MDRLGRDRWTRCRPRTPPGRSSHDTSQPTAHADHAPLPVPRRARRPAGSAARRERRRPRPRGHLRGRAPQALPRGRPPSPRRARRARRRRRHRVASSPPSSASWPTTAAPPRWPRSMHQHVVAFTAWRYRRGLPGAEATLRRVADEGIVLVSTGGGDYTHPRGDAVKVDGGYRRLRPQGIRSQSPVAGVMSTMFAYDDPEQGRRVLNMAVADRLGGRDRPRRLGHPRHAGHRQQRRRPRGRVRARRAGAGQPPLRRDRPAAPGDLQHRLHRSSPARTSASPRRHTTPPSTSPGSKADDALVQRQVGLMAHRAAGGVVGARRGARRGRRRPHAVGRAGRRR